jgi:ubiquitin carboxyl-terminal hydrolase 10
LFFFAHLSVFSTYPHSTRTLTQAPKFLPKEHFSFSPREEEEEELSEKGNQMSEVIKDSIAPLVQRILAEPLRFTPAKQPETHTDRPKKYVKIGASHSKELASEAIAMSTKVKDEEQDTVERKIRPQSLAQALAGYTGKRVLDDEGGSKKKRKKAVIQAEKSTEDTGESVEAESTETSDEVVSSEQKEETPSSQSEEHSDTEEPPESPESTESTEFVSETPRNIVSAKVFEQFQSEKSESDTPVLEEDDEEEDDDDEDYNDPRHSGESEESSNSEESHGSESEHDSASEGESEGDVELLKKEQLETVSTTPPTSPESEDEEQLPSKTNKLTDFYQINEIAHDTGSNASKRLVKNWGPLLTSQKPMGLLNHGVTCYTNAAVQAMIHIPAVQHYLNDVLKGKYKDIINPRSVTQVLAETSSRMWNPDKKKGVKYINPKKLISRLDDINCMMSEWQQEDSHEYFMSLLSRLQEDSTPKGHKLSESIIYDIFGGLLDQSVTCKSCGHISKTQQEFYDLSLHLGSGRKNSDAPLTEKEQLSSEETSQRYSIQKSIRDFFSPELIKPDRSDKSGYVCEKCKQRTNAIKISSIDHAPETLAVHLKRFRFNGSSSSKVKQGVSYPLILDLSQYTTKGEPVLYQLISVIVHAGRSVSSGHYIAHCRQPDGSWATYDDEYINPISEKQALRDSSAYYLIYTRLTHKNTIDKPSRFNPITQTTTATSNSSFSSSSSASTPVSSPKKNSNSTPSSPKTSVNKKRLLHSIGAITLPPQKPSQQQQQSLSKHKLKKNKMAGMKPTNNLGNITGKKQKRYTSKAQGSRRFKKY